MTEEADKEEKSFFFFTPHHKETSPRPKMTLVEADDVFEYGDDGDG